MGDWKTISTKAVYKNPKFSVQEDKITHPDGRPGIYYVINRVPFVLIVPITAGNEIYLIHISRYTTKKSHWELPAGSTDGEDALFAAKRELKEETGLTSQSWLDAGTFEVAPGMTAQTGQVFIAKNVIEKDLKGQKEEAIDQLKKVTFKKVLEMIATGEIVDGPTIAAITLTGLKLKLL